jgi:hypothetical protein
VRIAVYCESRTKSVAGSRIGTVSFDWSPESKLVSFDAVDEQGQSYTVQF